MIDLRKFCCCEFDPRFELRQPFLFNGWRYATNGHVAVRIREEGDEPMGPPPQATKLASMFDSAARDHYGPVPAHHIGPSCQACDGSGKCPKLGGGERLCTICWGFGSFYMPARHGGVVYDARYLTWIDDLPNPRISTQLWPNVSHFVFDGGEGILAPVEPRGMS